MAIVYRPVQCALTIVLESALHIGTGLGLGQLLDELTVQGPHPDVDDIELPYIPGASLKGRLRHHVRQLSGVLLNNPQEHRLAEAHLFGFDNRAGGLIFVDAHLPAGLARSLKVDPALSALFVRGERSFVSLSRQRRVALEERLFRIQLAEHGLSFATTVHGHLPAASAARDLGLLLASARDLTHLGGHKGRGLGRCRIDIGEVRLNGEALDWRKLVEKL
jgi:CRISPR/Cas system CSM-associated protein Csm3 (group 7 of RAMP superfamily)